MLKQAPQISCFFGLDGQAILRSFGGVGQPEQSVQLIERG